MSQSLNTQPDTLQTGMRRPATRGEARRREILAVAETTFLELGYEKTSVDEIAARAGSSKATIYKYFGSKDSLFAEVLHNIVPDISGDLFDQLDSRKSFREILFSWSMHIIDTVTTPRSISMYKLIVNEATRSIRTNVIHYESGPRVTHKELAHFLAQADKRGWITCDEPEIVARVFASAAFGEPFEYAVLGLPGKSREDIAAYVNQAIAMLEAYCKVRERN